VDTGAEEDILYKAVADPGHLVGVPRGQERLGAAVLLFHEGTQQLPQPLLREALGQGIDPRISGYDLGESPHLHGDRQGRAVIKAHPQVLLLGLRISRGRQEYAPPDVTHEQGVPRVHGHEEEPTRIPGLPDGLPRERLLQFRRVQVAPEELVLGVSAIRRGDAGAPEAPGDLA